VDVDAAVEVAAKHSQMAVDHSTTDEDGNIRRYYLWTQTDEPVTLTLSRMAPAEPLPEPIQVDACVGRFGNSKREAQLVRAVTHRLAALAKEGYAEIRLPP
jgi:hypothetical protein